MRKARVIMYYVLRITIQYEKKEIIDLGHELGQSSGQSLVNKVPVGLFLESIISYLKINPLSRKEIVSLLGKENASGFLNRTISKLIAEGLIEHTIKDNPNHPLQKIRLTEKGIELYNKKNGKQK